MGFIGGLARRGTSVIFSTHNVREADRFADRVLVLGDGEPLFLGAPADSSAGPRRLAGTATGRLRRGLRRVAREPGPLTACAGC